MHRLVQPSPLSPNSNLRLQRIIQLYHLTSTTTAQNVSQPLHQDALSARRGPSPTSSFITSTIRKLPFLQLSKNALGRATFAQLDPPNYLTRKHYNPPTHLLPHNATLPHSTTATLPLPKSPTPIPNPRSHRARINRPMDALHHTVHTQLGPNIHFLSHLQVCIRSECFSTTRKAKRSRPCD